MRQTSGKDTHTKIKNRKQYDVSVGRAERAHARLMFVDPTSALALQNTHAHTHLKKRFHSQMPSSIISLKRAAPMGAQSGCTSIFTMPLFGFFPFFLESTTSNSTMKGSSALATPAPAVHSAARSATAANEEVSFIGCERIFVRPAGKREKGCCASFKLLRAGGASARCE